MSTFNGVVKEFPRIRIDHFRRNPDERYPPLAFFLSHVHSDHLTGLETCKSPFIYCSSATRDVLLGLEKYQHRMNFAKQILEAPTKTYRHLKKILRPIPLETPTTIELAPGNEVRVTLFDANHCVGAVMFLIEGDGRAILYTGDIRSESWWVNNLMKHPLLVPYVARDGHGGARKPLKVLDCMYADTTFASKEDPYKRFPSKSEGLMELLEKISEYPKGTSFHFKAWTFGYEEVWEALASHMGTRVHVDAYKWKLYRSLANGIEPRAHDAAKYTGFKNGNGYQEGCLTQATESKLHSCEKGTECAIWNKDFVQITPIISRHNGIEMAEMGAGGGQGDLGQHELDINDVQTLGMLFSYVMSKVKDDSQQKAVIEMLNDFMTKGKSSIALDDFDLEDEDGENDNENIDRPIDTIVPILSQLAAKLKASSDRDLVDASEFPPARSKSLPKQITFPYSRHSSYSELCDLVDAFKPADIHPCTVDSVNWTMEHSMSFLFGHIYAGGPAKTFGHDQEMISKMTPKRKATLPSSRPSTSDSQSTRSSAGDYAEGRRRKRASSDEDGEQATSRKHRSRDSREGTERRRSKNERPDHDSKSHGRRHYDEKEHHDGASESATFMSVAQGQRLYIGNLALETTERDLRKFFRKYLIDSVSIPLDPRAGGPAGYGFVNVATKSEAERAVDELDGRTLLDRKLLVQYARNASADHYRPDREYAATRAENVNRRGPSDPHTDDPDTQGQLARAMRRNANITRRERHKITQEQFSDDLDVRLDDSSTSRGPKGVVESLQRLMPSAGVSDEEVIQALQARAHRGMLPRPRSQRLNDDGWDRTGRLSPPPTYSAMPRSSRPLTDHGNDSSPNSRIMKVELSPAEKSAKAIRHQEAYQAALGVGGRQWSDIGLISSGGHQVKEKEL